VGGYNTGTHEVCRYSACGPTRPTGNQGHRQKPDVCAPAEDDARGRGVLSASSRKSRATRMNGTSAAAPHVTGLVALLLQYRRDTGAALPNANVIRAEVRRAASRTLLRANRHNDADATRLAKLKQSNVMPELIGSGKIDVGKTI
jgi:subtilisin family serine protease